MRPGRRGALRDRLASSRGVVTLKRQRGCSSRQVKEETMVSNSDFGGAGARDSRPSADERNVDADSRRAESSPALDESVAGFDCPAWWVARIERRLAESHGRGRTGH
jgi:hypothetical protein